MKIKSFTFIIFLIIVSIFAIELSLRYIGLGSPIIYKKSILFGYYPAENQKVKRLKNSFITINNKGFRSLDKFEENKSKIFILGDSVVYGGSYIDDKKTFSNLLCSKINKTTKKDKFSCHNGGVNAYGIENIMERYNYLKNKYPKANYILILNYSNFYRNFMQIESLPYFSKQNSGLLKATKELLAFYIDKIRFKLRYKSSFDNFDYSSNASIKLRNSINYFDSRINFNNTKVFLWTRENYNPEVNNLENITVNELIGNYNNIINLSNLIQNKNGLYHDSIHLSEKGHIFFAEQIYKFYYE